MSISLTAIIELLIFSFGILVSLKFSKSKKVVILTDSNLKFNDEDIKLLEIIGYYVNREGVYPSIEIIDINKKIYSITSSYYGVRGKDFKIFLSDFIKKMNSTEIRELSYYDFHNQQYIFFKIFIYVMYVVVGLFNLVYFYLVIFKKLPFDWRILFINFLFVWLYNFHKRNEKKYKKK
jgi:hypothetical protein